MLDYERMISQLENILQKLHENKQESDDDKQKRHLAVAYTEVEKVKAYIQTYLVEESEL